jgi:hypothetical protein
MGGILNPSENVTVKVRGYQEFFITVDESYVIEDAIINGTSFGPIDFLNFTSIHSNQTIDGIIHKKNLL